MAELKLTLKRVEEKGYIKFKAPEEIELRAALQDVLRLCRDKYNDYVQITLKPPFKPRTTGNLSQNHHLNAHIIQICNETKHSYDIIKYCIKMLAVEEMEYPYEEVDGHIMPKGERDCNTEECAKLIEAAHVWAAHHGIILREE